MQGLINALTPAQPLTMTSYEIAELVEVRHDNVRRTIETLAEKGVIVRPQIEGEHYPDKMGRLRTRSVYIFSSEQGKRDSIVVVAQLSPEFTARLVDRWQELENQACQRMSKTIHPHASFKQLSETTRAFRDVYRLLRTLDVDKNTAAMRANQAAREITGLDFLERTGTSRFIAEKAEQEAATHQDHPLVEAFWEQFDYLDGKTLKNGDQIDLNHSRDEKIIAVNLVEYEAACSKAGLHLPCELAALKKRLKTSVQRKFVEMKPIRSNFNGRLVRCWLFQAGKARQIDHD